jgi:hypothetical protein
MRVQVLYTFDATFDAVVRIHVHKHVDIFMHTNMCTGRGSKPNRILGQMSEMILGSSP